MNKEEYEIINVPTIGRAILNNKTKKIYYSEFEIIEEKNKEIDKLNNVINELEEYINKNIEITKVAVSFNEGINDAYEVKKYKRDIDLFTMVLDKLKELKENKQ